MTAHACLTVTPLMAFQARAEARALLVTFGELDFHDAVDKLQADAERDGIIAAQAIMAVAFRNLPDDMRLVPGPLEEPARPAEVPQSTLDAADYVRRQGNAEELRTWLIEHRKYLAGILKHWKKEP